MKEIWQYLAPYNAKVVGIQALEALKGPAGPRFCEFAPLVFEPTANFLFCILDQMFYFVKWISSLIGFLFGSDNQAGCQARALVKWDRGFPPPAFASAGLRGSDDASSACVWQLLRNHIL